MRTVHEVSELAGVSIRTLQYYDNIGLLCPTHRSAAGYRMYDEQNLVRLQQILLFRELEFSLKDIKRILDSPEFDQTQVLDQQIELLELKRAHITKIIGLARSLRNGEHNMSFEAFDTKQLDEYARKAKESWGDQPAWTEYEQKSRDRTKEDEHMLGQDLMKLFEPFGAMAAAGDDPTSAAAQQQAAQIQSFITEHYYTCTNEIFAQLGQAYGAGGDFTRNIDAAAGAGAAQFAAEAIAHYCAS